MISETIKAETIVETESLMSMLIPDSIEKAYDDFKSSTRDSIKDYMSKTISDYLKENGEAIATSAPYGTQTIVADVIMNTHEDIGECAGNLAIKYIGSKVP